MRSAPEPFIAIPRLPTGPARSFGGQHSRAHPIPVVSFRLSREHFSSYRVQLFYTTAQLQLSRKGGPPDCGVPWRASSCRLELRTRAREGGGVVGRVVWRGLGAWLAQ